MESRIFRTMLRSNDSLAILTPHLEILQLQDSSPVISNTTNLLPYSMAATSSMGLLSPKEHLRFIVTMMEIGHTLEIEGVGEVLKLMSSTESDVLWVQEQSLLYCTIVERYVVSIRI